MFKVFTLLRQFIAITPPPPLLSPVGQYILQLPQSISRSCLPDIYFATANIVISRKKIQQKKKQQKNSLLAKKFHKRTTTFCGQKSNSRPSSHKPDALNTLTRCSTCKQTYGMMRQRGEAASKTLLGKMTLKTAGFTMIGSLSHEGASHFFLQIL